MSILMQINDQITFETMEPTIDWLDNVPKQKKAYKRLVQEMGNHSEQFQEKDNAELALKMMIGKEFYNFSNGHVVTFVKNGEKYVGYFAWYRTAPTDDRPGENVWITHAFIEEQYRHQGLYTQFMAKLPELYDEIYVGKLENVYCGVYPLNEVSMNAHSSLGFEVDYVCFKKKIDPQSYKSIEEAMFGQAGKRVRKNHPQKKGHKKELLLTPV